MHTVTTPEPATQRGLILAAGAIVAATAAAALAGELAVLGLLLAVAGLAALPFARGLMPVYLAAIMGFCVLASEYPVPVGVQWYGSDGMLFFLAAAVLVLLNRGSAAFETFERSEKRLLAILGLLLLCGALAAMIGAFARGYPLNDVLGDFRRRYFYPLIFVAPLVLVPPRGATTYLQAALLAATALVLLTGIWRAATGQSWNPENHAELSDAVKQLRYLSYTETTTICAGLALAVVQFRTDKHPLNALLYAALAMACIGILLISGWRLALLLAIAVPVAALALTVWLRRERFFAWLRVIVILTILATLGVGLLAAALPERSETAYKTMMVRLRDFDPKDDMRYYAWREALGRYAQSPVTGTGLGDELVYFSRGTEGTFVSRTSSAHSTFISVLYQAGPLGFLVFTAFHVAFLLHVGKRLRRIKREHHPLAAGMLIGYLSILAFSLVEPLQVANIVTQYLLMGFLVWLVRENATPVGDPA